MSNSVVADYIVVGGGSAGCVIATRLAESGAWVVLFEAGGTDRRPDVSLPIGIASLYATANWKYPTVPDPSKGDQPGAFASGRILGGSGSINAMVYVRGRRSDYDTWAHDGAAGWSFDDVLPHFKAVESWVGGADAFRGGAGPIAVSWCGHHHELDDAFIQAAVDAGYGLNADQNGATQLGVARAQVNQRRGLRCSSARGFLHRAPRGRRPVVMTGRPVSRIVIEGGRAVGVESKGQIVRAREEVILSAGAIGSPALLLRSGIGPRGTVVNLPGVGENFQDHLVVAQHWSSKVPTINTMGPVRAAKAVASLVARGTGALTTTPFEAQLFTEDYQIAISPVRYKLDAIKGRASLQRSDAFTVYTVLLHPEGRGRVRLHGDRPVVEHARLSNGTDVRKLLDGAELTRELVEARSPLRALTGRYLDDNGVTGPDWLVATEDSICHAVGTCRIGSDEQAVVDTALRVHGVDRLRVVDASVMPTLPSGNTNAPTMMIAHRAGDLLLGA